jgi:hypothetical protein
MEEKKRFLGEKMTEEEISETFRRYNEDPSPSSTNT